MATYISTNSSARDNSPYLDLDLNFLAHPATKDITKKKGVEAVKRAIRNLMLLKPGELGFNPSKGSGLHHLIFENISPATITLLNAKIKETIEKYEPRAELLETIINDDDRNGLNIDIIFRVINQTEPVKISLFLERVR